MNFIYECGWKLESFIVFTIIIIQWNKGVEITKEIWCRIQHSMHIWDQGKQKSLEDYTDAKDLKNKPMVRRWDMEEYAQKAFIHMLLQENIQKE